MQAEKERLQDKLDKANGPVQVDGIQRRCECGAFKVEPLNAKKGDTMACVACEAVACAMCHKELPNGGIEGHECNPDDLATANALRRFVPCPGCAVITVRGEGCNQVCRRCWQTACTL
jgi:hypothetical protein